MKNKLEANLIKVIKDKIASISTENRLEVREDIQDMLYLHASNLFKDNFLFVYGTLRRGESGYKELKALFGEEGIEFITHTQVDYRKIVDLGSYPALIDSIKSSASQKEIVIGDIIYISDEAGDYIKEKVEADGFISEEMILWVPAGKGSTNTVKILYLPCYVAGDNLIKEIKDNKTKYPEISIADWCRYQRQTKEGISEAEKLYQLQMWASEYGYYD